MELSPGGETSEKKPIVGADGSIISASNTIEANFKKTKSSNNLTSNIDTSGTSRITVEQFSDLEILPLIYDIVACVEKDSVDSASKQREGIECSQKILELQKRFESARAQIKQLPGIDFNREEQLQQFEQLKNQLKKKQNLLIKYKDMKF